MIRRMLMTVVAVVATVHSGLALATPVLMDAFSDEDVMINFDDPFMVGSDNLLEGTLLTNQYEEQGVVFFNANDNGSRANTAISDLVEDNSEPNVIWSDQGGGAGGSIQVLELDFVAENKDGEMLGVEQVGVQFITSRGANFTMEIFDVADELLESMVFTGDDLGNGILEGFAGLSWSEEPIFKATFASNATAEGLDDASYNFGIDDLRFTVVPEPATAALMALGLLGLALQGRRSS